ncbi:ABC transporter ATP-binding protein [Bacillaceae bacterium Marseille-Q3522]|nr:ABC transporter ATP-binding protein [Bacillaceae bacterium Marseille-Q3522]
MIHLQDVSLIRNGKKILQNMNWDVEEGENWVIYGLNGAGKTALLQLICAYYFPTSGKAAVLGKEFGKVELGSKLRRHIGIISAGLQQKIQQYDSGFEIVLSGAYASIGLYQKPTDEVREKAVGLMKKFGCIEYADRHYSTLSQGEKQRILICRALMLDPQLVILDEPVTGLDFIAREYVLETIEEMSAGSHAPTLLYVTHHAEEILPVFRNTLLLKKGRIFAAGKTKEMFSEKVLSDFFTMPVHIVWNQGRPTLMKA